MSPDEVRERLGAPFHPDDIGWKPQSVKGNRALAVAYIDARTVEDRLDEVFGVGGWQDELTPLPDGNVMCRLSCLVNGAWVAKCDIGGPSEQPDGGDRMKAAYSDALKRAAVKWGIGRYLYELPKQWCDFDPQKKQFAQTPRLPAKYLPPGTAPKPAPGPRPAAATAAPPQAVSKDEFKALMSRKGWTWDRVLREIDAARKTAYVAGKATFEQVPVDTAADFAAWLAGEPDAGPREPGQEG